MALSLDPLIKLPSLSSFFHTRRSSSVLLLPPHHYSTYSSSSQKPNSHAQPSKRTSSFDSFRVSYRFSDVADGDDETGGCGFDEAVALFNSMDYYRCHDFLEALWNQSQDPIRTLIHGILQCAVGFHHLFNQNHRGAMMELGEGLCKLRKMNFDSGPFHQFERDISVVLDFIYQTQIELAACSEDLCLAMDQTERSYQLLGGYAAGQRLYCLESGPNGSMYIVFCPERSYGSGESPKVKLPTLHATEEHLIACEYN